jgi:hypothetical protein
VTRLSLVGDKTNKRINTSTNKQNNAAWRETNKRINTSTNKQNHAARRETIKQSNNKTIFEHSHLLFQQFH